MEKEKKSRVVTTAISWKQGHHRRRKTESLEKKGSRRRFRKNISHFSRFSSSGKKTHEEKRKQNTQNVKKKIYY